MDSTGFLPPEEFIPWLILGRGRMHFDDKELDNAMTMFDILSEEYPESDSAPQALYFTGVCKYKLNDEAAPLKQAYELIRTRYLQHMVQKGPSLQAAVAVLKRIPGGGGGHRTFHGMKTTGNEPWQ